MRARRVVVVAVVGLLVVAATAFAAAGATGNRRAIAIARAEARAYNQVPAVRYRQTGYIEMITNDKRILFDFAWGETKLHPGWSWATENGTIALRHNHVVWWRDDLTPPRCAGPGVCHRSPVEIIADDRGAFWTFGDASRHSCFARLTGSQPFRVGRQANRVGTAHFSAPRFGSKTITLTYSGPDGKLTATETDTLSRRTDLLEASRTVLTGGHTIHLSQINLSATPKAPAVNLCR